jgi:hypothetical protein
MLTILWQRKTLAKLAIFCGVLGNLFVAATEIDVGYRMFRVGPASSAFACIIS